MRSPAIAFSLFAAAAVSASAHSLAKSPDLSPSTFSSQQGSMDLANTGLTDHIQRRGSASGAGLGISSSNTSSRFKRASGPQRLSHAEQTRPGGENRPPTRPQGPNNGGTTGCSGPDNIPGGQLRGAEDGTFTAGGKNGGVSCSSNAQGASADTNRQDGSDPDAESPNAVPAGGNDGVGGILNQGQSDGTLASPSASGNKTNLLSASAPAYGDYPSDVAAHTGTEVPTVRRDLSPQEDAQSNLYELVNGTSTGVTARSLQKAVPSDGVRQDGISEHAGADGKSIRGAAIPGTGTAAHPGGDASSGTPGYSGGGRVIESGHGSGDGMNKPGAGGVSRTGTAVGGNGLN